MNDSEQLGLTALLDQLGSLLDQAGKVTVIVANNPDADSLGSALALEEIWSNMGKEVSLYCRTEIPTYLRFLTGWERFNTDLSGGFELAVMVDNSVSNLLGAEEDRPAIIEKLKLKPFVILDHHASDTDIDFATLRLNRPEMAATGQLILAAAKHLGWPLNETAATFLTASILSDSLGFTSQGMVGNSEPLRAVADLVDLGVNLSDLSQRRLKWQELPASLLAYRGELLQRIRFHAGEQIATLAVEYEEIKQTGTLFNPTIVLDEMKAVENVRLSLGFKKYEDQRGRLFRVTLRIRCYRGCQIAKNLAETFGGGGHPYAAGAKWEATGLNFSQIEADVLRTAQDLLAEEAGR